MFQLHLFSIGVVWKFGAMFDPEFSRPCLTQHFPSMFNPVLSQILHKCLSFPRMSSATFNPVLSQQYVTQYFLAHDRGS